MTVANVRDLSYAEMNDAEKNKISHRYKALEKLKAWLVENHK